MCSWWCGAGGATVVAQRWRSGGCTLSCVKSSQPWQLSAGVLTGCRSSLRLWNKWLNLLHQFDPAVLSTAWGFECHQLALEIWYLHSWSLCGAYPKVKCLLSTTAIWQAELINWWVILSCGPNSVAGILPQGVGLTTSDEASGVSPKERDGQGPGLPLGFGQLSVAVPLGWQMENYVSQRGVPKAPWATRRNQAALLRLVPESSGFCRCRSHWWNQNLLFQMERQTMQNMSWCSLWQSLQGRTAGWEKWTLNCLGSGYVVVI